MRSSGSTTRSGPTKPGANRRRRRAIASHSGRIPSDCPHSNTPVTSWKKVTTAGTFRFRNRLVYLANAMVDQPIERDYIIRS